jgi:protein-disulfide isomerase
LSLLEDHLVRKVLIVAGVALVLAVAAGAGYQQWRVAEQSAAPAAAAPAPGSADAGQLLAAAEMPEIQPDDRIMGSADAPVTIIEYASLTCPHCAAFHTKTLPEVKSTYIDEGLARLVFRDFPLDRVALKASLLARCVPDERYFAMLGVLFSTQDDWARAADPQAALTQIGRTAGLDQATIDACLSNEAETDEIIAGIQAAQDEFKINSTPTLVINGTVHPGALTFEQMEEILKDLLPKS